MNAEDRAVRALIGAIENPTVEGGVNVRDALACIVELVEERVRAAAPPTVQEKGE